MPEMYHAGVPEFAQYDPQAQRRPLPPGELCVRAATSADLDALADIAHAREGGDRAAHRQGLESELHRHATTGDALLLAGCVGGRTAAFGRCGCFTPPPAAPANCIPPGWYLTGVVVRSADRRLGLGTALTQARIAWIFERSARVYYFVNSRNAASIALHARLGFREVARDIWTPTRGFDAGIGLLFALDRAAQRASADGP